MNGSFFDNLYDLAFESSPPGFTFPTNSPPKVYHVKFFTTNVTPLPTGERNATGGYRVIECTLYNATYDVHFALHSDGRQITTWNRTLLNGLPLTQVLPNAFSKDQAIELFNDIAFAEMYAQRSRCQPCSGIKAQRLARTRKSPPFGPSRPCGSLLVAPQSNSTLTWRSPANSGPRRTTSAI
jgi:hypothetical protein